MKKFLCLLILPFMAMISLVGCGSDRSVKDIQKLYTDTTSEHLIEETNIFFSNELDSNILDIYYPTVLEEAIEAENPSNDVQKRYKALGYQQKILDIIFEYYSNNQEEFYKVAESSNIDQDELNDLYDKLSALNNELDAFVSDYETFIDAVNNGISSIMRYSITSYTFQLNNVIDKAFEFMYKFHNVYVKYCLSDFDLYTEQNIRVYVDKANLDMAYIVYLENIKAFNFSVGENGICDLAEVIGSDSEFNLLELLDNKKSVSVNVISNLIEGSTNYEETIDNLNEFCYSRNVFDQKLNSYLTTYVNLDMYTINGYRFNQVGGVTYDNYINSLSGSDRATVMMLENFIEDNFKNYMEKLNYIVS